MPMKTIEGYSKEKYTDTSVLLAGGGAKALSDFIGTLNWDSTNKKIQYKKIGDTNYTDLLTINWSNVASKPETATRWPDWSEVTNKPDTATRWPEWSEITSRPNVLVQGGVIDTHGEGNNTIILGTCSELGAFYERGGTCTAYEVSASTTNFTGSLTSMGTLSNIPAAAFNGLLGYLGGSYSGTNLAVYDLYLPSSYSYGTSFYWSFGNTSWSPKTIGVYNSRDGVTWRECYFSTDAPAFGACGCSWNSNDYSFRYLRLVFSKYTRCAGFGLTNYQGTGLNWTYMNRGQDDLVYRSITPGKNDNYSLGSTTYKWKNVYATTFHGSLDGDASTLGGYAASYFAPAVTGGYVKCSGDTMTGALTGTTIYSDRDQSRKFVINHQSDSFGDAASRGFITYGTTSDSYAAAQTNHGLGIYLTGSVTSSYSRIVLTALSGIYLDGDSYINSNLALHAGNSYVNSDGFGIINSSTITRVSRADSLTAISLPGSTSNGASSGKYWHVFTYVADSAYSGVKGILTVIDGESKETGGLLYVNFRNTNSKYQTEGCRLSWLTYYSHPEAVITQEANGTNSLTYRLYLKINAAWSTPFISFISASYATASFTWNKQIVNSVSGTALTTAAAISPISISGSAGSVAWSGVSDKPDTATRWPSWSEVSDKPATATRWPSWDEVTSKPSTFTPESHSHDDLYYTETESDTRFIKIGGDRYFAQYQQGTWTRLFSFVIPSQSYSASIAFRWIPAECARGIWADYSINIRDNDILFYSVYHGSGTRTLKCVGDGTTFHVWVSGTKTSWDPFGLIQIVATHDITSYSFTASYTDTEPSGTYSKTCSIGGTVSYATSAGYVSNNLSWTNASGTAQSYNGSSAITVNGIYEANRSTYVKDIGDSTAISFKYSSGGFTSNPSYLAAWNGYQITYVAPSYVNVGNATNATYVKTVQTETNATYYLSFVDSTNSSATSEQLYTSKSGLTCNPYYGSLNLTGTDSRPVQLFNCVGYNGSGTTAYFSNNKASSNSSSSVNGSALYAYSSYGNGIYSYASSYVSTSEYVGFDFYGQHKSRFGTIILGYKADPTYASNYGDLGVIWASNQKAYLPPSSYVVNGMVCFVVNPHNQAVTFYASGCSMCYFRRDTVNSGTGSVSGEAWRGIYICIYAGNRWNICTTDMTN